MVSPVRSRSMDSRPCSRRCWQKSAVRRHCQITAGPSGCPLERSHARMVSRWLEIPIAASLSEEIWLTQPSTTVCTAFQMASGSCSTHPGCGNAISIGTEALATILASRSMTMALVFDVPWSMARRKSFGMGCLPVDFSPADKTAVYDKIDAGAKGSCLAGEEDGRPDHFIDLGHAPHRSVGFELLDLIHHLRPGIHRSRGVAGADRVYAYARWAHSIAKDFVRWITAAFEAL